ncbi:UNVERIFIED_CONTAM: hypothetical protein NCL1_25531 [Trichonephila clavipes]
MLHPDCIQATVKYPYSLMILSCILAYGIGRLHIIDGTLNVIKYIDTILEPKLLPAFRDLFTNNASFIFQYIHRITRTPPFLRLILTNTYAALLYFEVQGIIQDLVKSELIAL